MMSENIPCIQTGYVDPLGLSLPLSCYDKTASGIKKACSELESVFLNYLLKEMRATIPRPGSDVNGYARDTYTSMLDMKLSEYIAERRGIGLGSVLSEQLLSDNNCSVSEKEQNISKK